MFLRFSNLQGEEGKGEGVGGMSSLKSSYEGYLYELDKLLWLRYYDYDPAISILLTFLDRTFMSYFTCFTHVPDASTI